MGSGSFDAGLAAAASRLVERALGVVPGERVLIVHDAAHDEAATVVASTVQHARSEPLILRLEDLGPRPHMRLHTRIAEVLPSAQVSLLLVDFHAGELEMRTDLIALAATHRLRHGHMVDVSRESMIAGFAVDPRRIADKARALVLRLRPDSRISVRSALGTDLTIQLAPNHKWVEYGAIVTAGRRVNLPGGELVTSPLSVDGVYVADGSIGDADGALRRRLQATPVTLTIAASRVQNVECHADKALARAISDRLLRTLDLDRVGLVSFGLNVGLGEPVGEIFTDQKLPGVHVSLGETFPDKTGASWTAKSWLAFTITASDADIEKTPVLRGGRYVI
jgi:aminopeptidase